VTSEAPTRTISVYLLREHVKDATDALVQNPEELETHQVAELGERATLYVARKPASPPKWTDFFDSEVDPPLKIARPNFSGVLLVKAARRLFALTFGSSGRFMLEHASYERNFGLRVALNSVNPDQIRSVQSRTFVDTALQVRRQVAEVSDIVGLEMDVQRDLLTNLEGSVRDDAIGKKMSGSDAARITHSMNARDVRSVCSSLLQISKRTGYKKRYPWIDWIAEVTNPQDLEDLENEALRLLFDLQLDRFDVYPPEMVNEDVVDYKTGRNTTVMEPTRQLLKATIERIDAPNPAELGKKLRGRYITSRNESGDPLKRWSWWECLYYEHRSSGRAFVLDRGLWFKVKGSEAKAVNDFVAALTPSGLALPDAKRKEIEKDYNERVCAERADFKLLDRNLIQPVTGESRIEICDLYAKSGELVHIKRRKGGSAGLSHLFGQAFVSSQLLLREPKFAVDFRAQLGSWSTSVKKKPRAADHPIVLGVILASESTGEGAKALPLFSKIFMRQNVQTLQTMGFKVHYDEIPAPLGTP